MNCNFRWFAILPLLCLLNACASNVGAPASISIEEAPLVLPEFPNLFGSRPVIAEPDSVQRLTPEQEQDFLTWFNLPENQAVRPHMRLSSYLFESTRTLEYENRTYTAAQTLELNSGNCMSLAVLTTALARLAGLKVNYQLVDSSPVFGLTGSLVSKEVHVKTVVFNRQESEISLDSIGFHFPERVVIDYFVSERRRFVSNISTDAFNAMYYLNIAGAALEEKDYNEAYWHVREALEHNPLDPTAWNIMAVIYRRAGELAKAEEIYLFAMEHAEDKLTLMKNYRQLLVSQARMAEAAAIESRLESMEDPSPFHWYALARNSYDTQDYEAAIRYFDRALMIAPYLHEAWLGKAQSFYQLDSRSETERALKMAIENADRMSTRSLYQAKLMALAGNN
jgi:Tfp pilus assembly protein PilF